MNQTLWLDQRGTGLSSPINADVFKGKGDQEIAQYLKQFRADNIGEYLGLFSPSSGIQWKPSEGL
jgi:hypothetical protein